jgi:hypothetical protein
MPATSYRGEIKMNDRIRAPRFLPIFLAFALTLFAVGSAEARGSKDGKLRAFHNSPDTPAVDIWVNGERVLERVSYGDLSGYLSVPQGSYDIEVKVYPSIAGDPAALAATVKVGRSPLTVAAIGSLAGQGEGLQAQVYRDSDGPRWKIVSKLRVAHTSPDAPAVDVQVNLFDRWITVVPGLAFGESSHYLTLPAIGYDFRVVVAGTETVALDLPDTQLPRGTAVTVWAVNPVSQIAAFISVDGR